MMEGYALKCGDPVSGPSSENNSYRAPSHVNWHLCIFLNSLRKKKQEHIPFSCSLPVILHSCEKARVSPGISVPTLFSAVHTNCRRQHCPPPPTKTIISHCPYSYKQVSWFYPPAGKPLVFCLLPRSLSPTLISLFISYFQNPAWCALIYQITTHLKT